MTDITSANRQLRLKKIAYRACHRGIQEMDIILGGYVDDVVRGHVSPDLDQLEELMSEQDIDLLNWITGVTPLDDAPHRDLIMAISAHHLRRFEKQ